ncbi:CPBP family intramembrane metalloprotease [Haloplanus rubicundus]|uniref:CPBP family intramembrane metalloprotease n=1 Tax=Haloplanus rubicundus TaxID=1547898 RepID=A0A345ECG0_9EURY|nr:CPBP family intramembrane glutamic endopeptidase [Haloplanus rubicundus]AXG06462.1 CPBP family intramembrane metalloprotease [Haloplanus rubicundus]AXG09882.1 CPBP family intramembrane metalloprotease [Haloplanus rubicundus]
MRLPRLSWVQTSLLAGLVLAVLWSLWSVPPTSLDARLVRDVTVFVGLPGALALARGRDLGWRVDRRALRNTLLLAAFVTPFYVVGASLPTIRAYYPMWETNTALATFVPHALAQFVVAAAAETYYRGLLCVGVREIGFKSVFISPVVYAIHHVHKPPIELLLSAPTDVLFGAVDYESESILPSVVAHGFGLALLDWLVLHPPVVPTATVVRVLSWLPVPL